MSNLEISVPTGVPVRDLASIAASFAALYNEVSKRLVSSQVAELHMVGHRPGSLVLECKPVPSENADAATVDRMVEAMMSGLEALVSGEEPFGFTNTALRHSANFVRPFTSDQSTVVISAGARSVVCGLTMKTTALRIANRISTSWGSVEGRIESVSLRGRNTFNLYELLSDERFECRFEKSQLPAVGAALGGRVVVSGEVHKKGDEISYVKVERFSERPPSRDLPSFADITGLFKPNGD